MACRWQNFDRQIIQNKPHDNGLRDMLRCRAAMQSKIIMMTKDSLYVGFETIKIRAMAKDVDIRSINIKIDRKSSGDNRIKPGKPIPDTMS